ncbi:MAG: LuxR C-terminal-related transcriptional regulator [Spirochaetes bacterium]|nr:LuxR C-terminal-related transcriptional regulator [Spirochaetota bacterium]
MKKKQNITLHYIPAILLPFVIIINILSLFIEKKLSQPVEFTFTLPLEAEVLVENNVKEFPEIEKVLIAGYFSDWDPDNPNYVLTPERSINSKNSINKKWTIQLPFDPGKHDFKYVIYIKDRFIPIWVCDKNAKRIIDPAIRTENSQITVYTILPFLLIFNFITAGFFIFVLLYSFHQQIFHLFIWIKHHQLYFMIITIILINFIYLLFLHFSRYHDQQNSLFSQASQIHKQIIGTKINLNHIHSKKVSIQLEELFKHHLWYRMLDFENESLEKNLSAMGLFYLDKNINILESALRIKDKKLANKYYQGNQEAIQNVLIKSFKDIITGFEQEPLLLHNYRLKKMKARYFKNQYAIQSTFPFVVEKKYFVYPILYQYQFVGYYAFYYQTDLISAVLMKILFLNLILCFLFLNIKMIYYFYQKEYTQPAKQIAPQLNEEKVFQYSITDREKEIILMINQGYSNKEIAHKLYLSRKTIDNHIYKIFKKADVKNRVEMVNFFIK